LSCETACKLSLAWGVQLVVLVGVAVAGVVRFGIWDGVHVPACVGRAFCASCRRGGGGGGAVRRVGRRACFRLRGACILCFLSAWRWRGWCRSAFGTACMLPLAWGGQFVLLVGVAVARVVRFDVWDCVHVAACVRRAVCAFRRRGGGGRASGRGGGGGAVRRLGRRACCRLRGACSLCFLSAWLWLTGSWTWWRGGCGLFRGTSCKMPLAWGVELVLPVGVAAADVELEMVAVVVRFVVRDRSQVASCVGRSPTFYCRCGCG